MSESILPQAAGYGVVVGPGHCRIATSSYNRVSDRNGSVLQRYHGRVSSSCQMAVLWTDEGLELLDCKLGTPLTRRPRRKSSILLVEGEY
jgi:hypothetical protein